MVSKRSREALMVFKIAWRERLDNVESLFSLQWEQ